MAMEIRTLNRSDNDTWDKFVKRSPYGSFFYCSQWLEIAGEVFGNEVAVYACFDDDELICGCPVSIRKKGFFTMARRPFATPYAGIILKGGDDDVELRALAEMICFLSSHFNYTKLVHTPSFRNMQAFRDYGWSIGQKYTYIIDLDDEESIWNRFECDLRNVIRKARRNGISVRECWDADPFYELYKDTFENRGISITITRDTIGRLCEYLKSGGIGRLFTAETSNGEVGAAAIVTWDETSAYYTLSASHPILRTSGAPSLLLWEIIREMSRRFRTFDLVGANIPSIAQFKKQFNPRLVGYHTSEEYSPRICKMLYRLYSHLPGGSR